MDEIDGRLVGGLMVLAAVADARSFGKAAERLGMTQSGVSKAMRSLKCVSASD
jgi:DNA-binding transcriptional LysR family regulator